MARKLRVHYEDAIYHVIARGNNKERIFERDEEKEKYLDILTGYKERYDFRLYAYVFMDNHLHLLLQVGKTPLAKIMQGIQQRYTQYYNRHHKHSGHVFEQRYKAFLCEQEHYLMALVCYIHQNPVRANLPGGIDYRWSSHRLYIRRVQGLVNVEFILDTVSSNPDKAMEQYLNMVGRVIDDTECKNQSEQGTEEQKSLLKAEAKKTWGYLTWEQLVAKISEEEKVDQEQLVGKCRIRQVVAARKRLVYEAIERELVTRTELAKVLQIDPANITRIWQELIDK